MDSLVTYRAEGPVAVITMDDGKVNALSPRLLAELTAAVDRAEADRAAVVLAGRPGVFSAGFDLRVLRAGGPDATAMGLAGFELAERLLSFPAPVVAACTGHAVAMGALLLLSADYRIGAAGEFKITMNEVAIGLIMPQVAIEICRQRLAPSYLTRAVVLAESFTPQTAVAAGFLDRTGPAAELAGLASAAAAGLARLDQGAHAATKRELRAGSLAAMRASLAADQGAIRSPG
jgi:enoyl-CoA hydratase